MQRARQNSSGMRRLSFPSACLWKSYRVSIEGVPTGKKMPSRIVFDAEDTVMDDTIETTEVEAVKVSRTKFFSADVEAKHERRTCGGSSMFNNMWLNKRVFHFDEPSSQDIVERVYGEFQSQCMELNDTKSQFTSCVAT